MSCCVSRKQKIRRVLGGDAVTAWWKVLQPFAVAIPTGCVVDCQD